MEKGLFPIWIGRDPGISGITSRFLSCRLCTGLCRNVFPRKDPSSTIVSPESVSVTVMAGIEALTASSEIFEMVYHVALITEATIAPIVAVNSCSSVLVSETAMVMMPNPVAKTHHQRKT